MNLTNQIQILDLGAGRVVWGWGCVLSMMVACAREPQAAFPFVRRYKDKALTSPSGYN